MENEKDNCGRKMQLKCDNCRTLKCKEAESGCKGFLDKAGKWIGDKINDVGKCDVTVVMSWDIYYGEILFDSIRFDWLNFLLVLFLVLFITFSFRISSSLD